MHRLINLLSAVQQ